MFIRKLAFSNFAVRKSRVALTVSAVALSVSLVVSVTSGYSSLFEAAYQYVTQYMGSTDARVSCRGDPIGVPWSIVEELRKDPAVQHVDARISASSEIPDRRPDAKHDAERIELIGIERPGDHRVDRLKPEAGGWFEGSAGNVAVLDQGAADTMKIKVGDSFVLPFMDRKLTLKVVGIVHKPAVAAAFVRTAYLPLRTLQQFQDKEGMVSSALIDLKDHVDREAFAKRWRTRFETESVPLQMNLTAEVREKMEDNLQSVRLLSYLGSAVSMLAATFIIFSALSMGVLERQRSLALLRAVGAFKSQIALLVIFEGLMLGTAGLLIGLPLGWLWIKVLSMIFSDIFSAGAVVNWTAAALGAAATLLTALAASLLPAWTATRVRPLEAMSPLSHRTTDRAPIGWAVAGLLLVSIDPFLFFGPLEQVVQLFSSSPAHQTARALKFYLHFALGLPGLFVGFFLISPMCVWVIERVAGPIVAAMLGLRSALVRQQLSTGIWRAAGTCAALMVGLAVLIVMQVAGHTMLEGWKLPDKFPDLFIASTGNLTTEEVDALRKTPGIHDMMRIEIAATYLAVRKPTGFLEKAADKMAQEATEDGGSPFAIAGSTILPNGIMWIGLDPDKAFKMMELDFRLGNAGEAEERLRQGGWVIVTEEYRQLKHCKIGDEIYLGNNELHLAPAAGTVAGRVVDEIHLRNNRFQIAGVIWSPGIDVMKGMYDMVDQLEQRTVSCVFGSIDDGRKFKARPYIFAADIEPGVDRAEMIKRIKSNVHAMGLQIGDVREIKRKIQEGFYRVLNLLSTVAFCAMAVASLGVMNTVIAGVRTRRWQFGILRSIGVTRGQLMRLVLAEAILLGLIGCVLGLAAGSLMATDALALTVAMVGYKPPLVIPWGFVAIGLGSVMFVSIAASLWPALDVARTEPLTLLQAGRAAS